MEKIYWLKIRPHKCASTFVPTFEYKALENALSVAGSLARILHDSQITVQDSNSRIYVSWYAFGVETNA